MFEIKFNSRHSVMELEPVKYMNDLLDSGFNFMMITVSSMV